MGHQIIKQPNGRYSVFSTVTDDIIVYDATKDELVKYYREEAAQKAEENTLKIFEKLEKGIKPYYQFTKSIDEMLICIKENHGEEIYNIRKKELGLSS